jgi:hypothetical protein
MNIPEQVLEKPGSRITGRFLIRLAENLRKIQVKNKAKTF